MQLIQKLNIKIKDWKKTEGLSTLCMTKKTENKLLNENITHNSREEWKSPHE